MGKFNAFVLGICCGFGLYHLGSHYHVVRTPGGVVTTPKLAPSFTDTYVDARNFSPSDWAKHPELSAALLKNGQSDLIRPAVKQAVGEAVEQMVDQVLGGSTAAETGK